MPEQVAMPFEVVSAKVYFNNLEATLAKPVHIEWNFALSRSVHHAAGHDKLSYSFMKSHKDLVGGEHHVFEGWDGVDGFYVASRCLEGTAESLPLLVSLLAIHTCVRHVGILPVDHIEEDRRTQQNLLGHLLKW
jgi:hypothetical protein